MQPIDPTPPATEVPEATRAELERERLRAGAEVVNATADLVPEDVLAERDLEIRAAQNQPGNDALLRADLDDDRD